MDEFDWSICYLKRLHVDNRIKSQKIKSDLEMIFCKSNMSPLNDWFFVWGQLIKDIFNEY